MDITITPIVVSPGLALDDPAPGPAPADAAASVKFSDLMDAPDAAAGPQATGAVEAVQPPAQGTLGDNILGGLQSLSTELRGTWDNLGAALNGTKTLAMQDLIKMQMGLSTMSVQYELVGKAVSRSTQNIDQLVKLQ